MREDKKDYFINLNSDFNDQNCKIKDTSEENHKIYNPQDINKIQVEEDKGKKDVKIYIPPDINKIKLEENKDKINENVNEKENIPQDINKIKTEENINKKDEKEKICNPPDINKIEENVLVKKDDKEEKEMIMRDFFNQTALIEHFVISVRILRKYKKIIMILFKKFKEDRKDQNKVSFNEHLLFEQILALYKEQFLKDKEKKLKEKNEIDDLYNYKNENSDEIEEEDNIEEACDDKAFCELMDILSKVKIGTAFNKEEKISEGENENDLIIPNNIRNSNDNDNNIISMDKLNKYKKSIYYPSSTNNFDNGFRAFILAVYDFCFKKKKEVILKA